MMGNIDLQLTAKRIRLRRDELRMTLAEVGNAAGIAASTVQRYEAASISRPKIPVLKAIAGVLKVSPQWILGFSDDMTVESVKPPANVIPADMSDTVPVPVIGRVAAGLACYAEEHIEYYEPVSRALLSSGDAYVYLQVTGASLSPLIMEGDLVLVRCQDMVDNGKYAVVLIDGEDGVVKRVFFSNGRIELRSENPYYPPRIFGGEDMSRIRSFGKVVDSKRKL